MKCVAILLNQFSCLFVHIILNYALKTTCHPKVKFLTLQFDEDCLINNTIIVNLYETIILGGGEGLTHPSGPIKDPFLSVKSFGGSRFTKILTPVVPPFMIKCVCVYIFHFQQ